jgi:hypothetical protein
MESLVPVFSLRVARIAWLVAAACTGATAPAPPPATTPAATATTAAPPALAGPCTERLVPYRDWPRIEAQAEWTVDLAAASGGKLLLFGMMHSDDPADPEFAAIDRAWSAMRPTAGFYEGPERPIADTASATIAATGESGYVRFLARRDGIPVFRLDPDPRVEAEYVLARHPRDQLFLFYVLREVVRLRDRKDVPREHLAKAVTSMIEQAKARNLLHPSASIEEFEAAYRTHLGDPPAWADAPAWWFSPMPRSDEKWTHRLNRDSSELRNRNMFEVLTASVRAGNRVFAVVGRNHVPMIAPALRCALAR